MFELLKNFLVKSVTGAFLNCLRPSLSPSDDNSEDKEPPQEVIVTKPPAKTVNIGKKSKELSLRDVWLCVDNNRKSALVDVNKQMKRTPEINNSHKQRKEAACLSIKGGTTLDIPETFMDLNVPKAVKNISLKILRQEDDFYLINEFIVSTKEIKKRFHVMRNIMPNNIDEYIEVPYSAKACNILFRFLFQGVYYINHLDTAAEMYALAQQFRLRKLQDECFAILADEQRQRYFRNEKQFFHDIVNQYKCNNHQSFVGFSLKTDLTHDIYFPFYPIHQLTMNEAFEKDIINTAIFESVKGYYLIWGIELCFNVENEDHNLPLNIIYKINHGDFIIEKETEECLKPSVNVWFEQHYRNTSSGSVSNVRWNNQLIEVSIIVQDIKPRLCFSSLEAQYVQKTNNAEFRVSLASSRKTDSNESLFYLRKIYVMNLEEILMPVGW